MPMFNWFFKSNYAPLRSQALRVDPTGLTRFSVKVEFFKNPLPIMLTCAIPELE
jgi:hypothetical protein